MDMDRLVFTQCLLIFTLFSVFTRAEAKLFLSEKIEKENPDGTNSISRTGERCLVDPIKLHESGPQNHSEAIKAPFPAAVDAAQMMKPPPPCPNNALYCDFDDYPKDIIDRKLKEEPKVLLDILRTKEIVDYDINRIQPDSRTGRDLCDSTIQIVYPQLAKSREGTFEIIVNNDTIRQPVFVDKCINTGGHCDQLPLRAAYTTSCVQKYTSRSLMVLNYNQTIYPENFVFKVFTFPSCCSCAITKLSSYDKIWDNSQIKIAKPIANQQHQQTGKPADRLKKTQKL